MVMGLRGALKVGLKNNDRFLACTASIDLRKAEGQLIRRIPFDNQ